ncbi:MAG: YidC/Oxa1 family membrane protein insertase [Chloroflexota bacterium]|nr:YidC/Oxa1 family membrane protein insertase [Chloroflexota bacterium]
MWDTIVVDPITNLLLLFYSLLNGQTILAVALLTLLVRLIMIPMTIKQQQSMQQQRKLQPRLKEIQEKYKNDQERLGKEQMKLYREAGVSPASGCLPLLIQFPLMIGLYRAIIRALAATPLELLDLTSHIYRVAWLPALSALPPLQSQFGWLDLALPDPYYILPVLVVVTSWLQQKLISATTPTTASAGDQAQAMTQSMQVTMPLFMGFVSMSYASGLSVYLVISNLVGIIQYYFIGKSSNDSAE